MNNVLYSRSVPIKYNVDVCVVGAGPAGIAASVTAARQGKQVYLADAHTCAGGMATAGMLPVFMPFTDGENFLAGGIGKEIHDRGCEYGAIGFHGGISINVELLKRFYDEMLIKSGVTLSYHTQLIDVVMVGAKIDLAVFAAKSGIFAVKAEVFVDCSGDGDLAYMAGAPYDIGDADGRMMPATLCSTWAGVDWERNRAGGAYSHNDEKMLELLKCANVAGVLFDNDYHHTGMFRRSKHLVGGNLTHCFGIDPTDESSLTRGLIEGRKLLAQYENFYRKYVPGFDDAELASSGSLLGVRESRRIIGDYVLCADDYIRRASFDDEIGRYNFSIDIHPSEPGMTALAEHKKHYIGQHYRQGESYGIPYRILCPLKVDNLLAAGRCVSTDRYVMASLRVMPGCFITGMASGMAAAIAVDDKCDPRHIDVITLLHRLKQYGAFLPNYENADLWG